MEQIWLVTWYFEPSQPQKIISGLKTNFNLSPNYSTHKSANHKFSKITKSILTQIYTKHTYTNIKHKMFEESIPSVLPVLRKQIKLGHAGIVDTSVEASIPDLKKKVLEKGMDRIFFLNI